MNINIIDREFNFLGQLDNYESLMLNKNFHGVGHSEFHIHETNNNLNNLVKENIVFTDNDKAYVILHREINSENGNAIIRGLELKSYLSRWLVFPPVDKAYYRVNSNVETIMKEYVQATLNRKGITNIVVAPNQNRGIETIYQSRYKNLAEELEKLSLASNLGWDITLNRESKKFVFDVSEGREVSASQSILPPAIFSIEFDNIVEQVLTESRLDYANTAIVAGQGEGVDRAIQIIGDTNGYDSFEQFVDARDIEDDTQLNARGLQKLSETQEIITLDSNVLVDKNLEYGVDFKLGDLVTVTNSRWNKTLDTRISEITEIYEPDGFRLDVVFGNQIPTILDKINKLEDNPIAEGGSKGEDGSDGIDGASGTNGVSLDYNWNNTKLGIKREDEINYSYTDLRGEQGARGVQGIRGPQGLKGNTGEQGPQGDTGPEGPQGIRGLTGSRGPQGLKGDPFEYVDFTLQQLEGLRGPQGIKGDKGDLGPRGLQGIKGDTGDRGVQGIQGPKGDKGNTGDRGVQGLKGDKGDPFKYNDFTTQQLLGLVGPQGLKGDTGPRGLQGTQGEQGIRGLRGFKGDKGDTGPEGPRGPKGDSVADSIEWSNILNKPGIPKIVTSEVEPTLLTGDQWHKII